MRPIMILIAALTVTSVAVAMRTTSRPVPAAPLTAASPAVDPQPPEKAVVGTLESVNTRASQITVNTSGGRQTFTVESDAMVRQGSRTIKAVELQSHRGERVKVRYRESGGVKHAEWIVLAAPPAKKAKSL